MSNNMQHTQSGIVFVLFLFLFLSAQLIGCGSLAAGGGYRSSSGYGFGDQAITRSDAAITAEIRQHLIKDPDIAATTVQVETHNGVVTLGGSVSSTALELRIIRLCKQTAGVNQVRSQLRVEP